MTAAGNVTYVVDGMTMVGYLARPDGAGPWPAVLIGHDGVGLDGYQRSRADILAEHGYVAFAMDYHGGQTYFGRPEAMLARVMPLLDDTARMLAIGKKAIDVLLAAPDVDHKRLAALGFGAGGRIVLELARAERLSPRSRQFTPVCRGMRTPRIGLASGEQCCCAPAPKIPFAHPRSSSPSVPRCRAPGWIGASPSSAAPSTPFGPSRPHPRVTPAVRWRPFPGWATTPCSRDEGGRQCWNCSVTLCRPRDTVAGWAE